MNTSWKPLILVAALSVLVGAMLVRWWPKPTPPIPPVVVVDTVEVARLQTLADSAAAAAQGHQARADSLARARQRLLSKVDRLEDSLAVVTTVQDSNVVLVELVVEQRMTIEDQRKEIYSLRRAGQDQMQESVALRTTIATLQGRERQHTHSLARQQVTIDSLVRARTKSSQCRILGVTNCPSRGTMYLGGIATAGLMAITINALK